MKVKNLYGTQLMAMEEHRKRKADNTANIDHFVLGASVQACSKYGRKKRLGSHTLLLLQPFLPALRTLLLFLFGLHAYGHACISAYAYTYTCVYMYVCRWFACGLLYVCRVYVSTV